MKYMEKLQDITDYKVMSFSEAAQSLGWSVEDDGECFAVRCNCGNSKIRYSGFIGTEIVECESCKRRITDLFSPLQTGNSTCIILKASEYEIEKDKDGYERYWIAEDCNGGIKMEESVKK